ncbi:MAG: hypothetical protein HQ559_09705 [Lentisphaerae bacterium]|nr:hypothetical protein [Lentisphaerota bacterium]
MSEKGLGLQRQLASVPFRNPRATSSPGDDGETLIVGLELQYRGVARWLGPFLPLRRRRRFRLEGLGRCVYESIDGKKTFAQLIDEFAAEHLLTFFESRALLMEYMRLLARRGLIAFGLKTLAKQDNGAS